MFLNDWSNKNVPNDYIAIDGHVCPDKTDQNKLVPLLVGLDQGNADILVPTAKTRQSEGGPFGAR